MNPIRRRLFAAGAASAAGALWLPTALAQSSTFPSRPIQFVVPFSPGGGNDMLARILAPHLTAYFSQPTVVVNKPGAGGNIGAQTVARSTPDGHTLLLATNTLTLNPFLMKNIPFDVVRDFAPVARIANQPIVVVVNPSLPVKNIQELVTYLKAHPRTVSYASPGVGTPHHFATELFMQTAGVDMAHIPYKGAAPALTDLIAGRVQVMFASIISALPFIKDGRLKALATAEGKRIPLLMDLPTIKESGYPGYEATIWCGVMVAAGTPKVIVNALYDALRKITREPKVAGSLQADGFAIDLDSPEEFGKLVRNDLTQWAKVAKAIGIQAE